MKKFFVSLMCVAMVICSTLGLSACAGDKDNSNTVDLSQIEVGAEIPVYPNCEFDYLFKPNNLESSDEQYTVHISQITAKLSKKNSIHKGDILTEQFYPFEIQVYVSGSTSPKLAGKILSVFICGQTCWLDIVRITCHVTSTGAFEGISTFSIYDSHATPIYFSYVSQYIK